MRPDRSAGLAWVAGALFALGCRGDADPEPLARVWRPEEARLISTSPLTPAIDREPHARQATATFALG